MKTNSEISTLTLLCSDASSTPHFFLYSPLRVCAQGTCNQPDLKIATPTHSSLSAKMAVDDVFQKSKAIPCAATTATHQDKDDATLGCKVPSTTSRAQTTPQKKKQTLLSRFT